MTTEIKTPDACNSIEEVRKAIDHIDREIIAGLALRYQYVLAAARFKTDHDDVRADKRASELIEQRKLLAREEGIDSSLIERIYTELIRFFIAEELKMWEKLRELEEK